MQYWVFQSIVKVKNKVWNSGGNDKVERQSLFSNLVGQMVARPNPFGANLGSLFHSYTQPVSTSKTYSGPRTNRILRKREQ